MEVGGLSGQPLAERSVEVVRQLRSILPEDMALVGVGGISTENQARDTLKAGAQALQIYTSFIYDGPKIVQKLTLIVAFLQNLWRANFNYYCWSLDYR